MAAAPRVGGIVGDVASGDGRALSQLVKGGKGMVGPYKRLGIYKDGIRRNVQTIVLELCQTYIGRLALSYAHTARYQACRFAFAQERKHQYLENGCGTRFEKVYW